MPRKPKGARRKPTRSTANTSVGATSKQKARTNSRIEARFQQASTHFSRGELSTAEGLCQEITERVDHPGASHLLGHIVHARGDLAGARQWFAKAVAADETFAPGHASLGVVHQQLGNINDAIASYRRAIELSPADGRAWFNLATAYKLIPDLERAVECYRRAVDIMPRDLDSLSALGRTEIELGQLAIAANTYAKAIEIAPAGSPEINDSFAFCAMRTGRPQEALAATAAVNQRHPRHLGSQVLTASAQLASGDFESAYAQAQKILAEHRGETQSMANLALAANECGDSATAIALYDFDRFLRVRALGEVVSGVPQSTEDSTPYASIEELNAALVAHINNHPTLRFEQHSLSCHQGATSDELLVEPRGPVGALETLLRAEIQKYIAEVAASEDHPFLDTRPRDCELSAWATVLQSGGHQGGHIHPSAWLSGVYYVSLPASVANIDKQEGWIEFGKPPAHYALKGTPRTRRVQPHAGTLCLFPSYFYHETIPFSGDQPRISIAFDYRPVRET